MLTQADVSGPNVPWDCDSIVDQDDLASFRLLTAYVPEQDEIKLRIDIKVGELQHGCTSVVGFPKKAEQKITATDPLVKPSSGVAEAMVILVPRIKLAHILRELAEKLEAMR